VKKVDSESSQRAKTLVLMFPDSQNFFFPAPSRNWRIIPTKKTIFFLPPAEIEIFRNLPNKEEQKLVWPKDKKKQSKYL